MPPIKLSKIVFVPDVPADPADPDGELPGNDGPLDLGKVGNQPNVLVQLPNGVRQVDLDRDTIRAFRRAVQARNIDFDDALNQALALYTARLLNLGHAPGDDD